MGEAQLFVCADGGANTAWDAGHVPHALVGDLDSVRPEVLRALEGRCEIVHAADQERTDMEKALAYVQERGPFEEILLQGASQGRLDHVLGNLGLLSRHAGPGRLMLEDGHGRAWLVREDTRLDLDAGTTVSFFAAGEPALGVTTENLRYPLRECTLEVGGRDSVCNQVTGRPAWIRLRSGSLLVLVVERP